MQNQALQFPHLQTWITKHCNHSGLCHSASHPAPGFVPEGAWDDPWWSMFQKLAPETKWNQKLCMLHLPLHLDCYVHLPRRLVSCAQTVLSHDSAWSKAVQHQTNQRDFWSKGHQPFATGRSPYSCKKKLDQLWHGVSQEWCPFRELRLPKGWFQAHPASSEVLFGLNLADMSPLLSWNWDSPEFLRTTNGATAVFPLFQEIGTMNIYELCSII